MAVRRAAESRSDPASLIGADGFGAGSATAAGPAVRLSRREREVALLIARGMPNRQIGAQLAIKERTVEDHVSRLLKKLKLANRAQVILWAIASGLVGTPDVAILAPTGDDGPRD
jgi:DNA-binding NarL/FixJ family response regulator